VIAPMAAHTRAVDLRRGVGQLPQDGPRREGQQTRAMSTQPFNEQYYEQAKLADDRIALRWYARVVQRLRPEGGSLLDFGCGTGHLLKRLSAHFEAYGYDASPFARNQCRSTAPDAVVLEDWESLPDASLDIIVSLHTLEHLPKPQPILQGLAAKLVSGGVLFFVVPNPGGLGHQLKGRNWFAYRDATHVSLLTRAEWVMLVRKAGLEVVRVRGDGLWDAPYVPLLPTALQRVIFGVPAALQVFWPLGWPFGQPFLPAALGECLIVTARKH
jgi:SAM-dependent methyltransferase